MTRPCRCFVLLITMCAIGFSTLAHAQPVGPPAPVNPGVGFTEQYKQLQEIWLFALLPHVQRFFFKLATLEVVLSAILWMAAQHVSDTLAANLFKKILWIAFGYTLLLHQGEWIPAIINSLKAAGMEASGLPSLDPGTVFLQGLGLATQMLWAMATPGALKHIIGMIIGILAAITVIIAFGFIAIEMAVTIVESYVVTGAGVVLLGFSAFRGTAAITERYLAYVIGVGLKFFVIYLIIGAGMSLAASWGAYVSTASMFEFTVPLTLAFGALLYFLLATRIPTLTASLATGTVGLGFGDVVATALGAIRGAAVTAGVAVTTGPIASGAIGVGQATARAAGGGVRGALLGMRATGGALSRESAAAAVPRLQRAAGNLQEMAASARVQQRTGPPEDFIR